MEIDSGLMQLSQFVTLFTNFTAKIPQKKLALSISLLFGGVIAFQLAQLTWLIVPNNTATNNPNKFLSSKKMVEKNDVDISSLVDLHLFGRYTDKPKKIEQTIQREAPPTRLNLKLSGVVASDQEDVAAAVIENAGKQETYGLGENITGTRATLVQVLIDRVLIKQSGNTETLMLDGFDYTKTPATTNFQDMTNDDVDSPQPTELALEVDETFDQRENEELSQAASEVKQDLADNPGKIIDYLNISPQRNGGKVVGYRLSPGKSPEFFQAAGLKSGDVAVLLNGFDLTETNEAAQALQSLREETQISLLVEREQELVEILFSVE